MRRQYDVPLALAGMRADTPPGHEDKPAFYVKDFTLSANGSSTDLIDIDRDAAFIWRALFFSSTGQFRIQFWDSSGYSYSNGPVASSNYSQDPANPTAFEVEETIPARGKIRIEITDTSGAGNSIQVVLLGVHRA